MLAAHLIEPAFYPRVWGSLDLRGWYPQRSPETEPIGEAWLTSTASAVLIKLLFPHQRLSVQVHPDDRYAAQHGLGRGKTEAWYVVDAAPEARLGIGLRAGARWEDLGAACRAGRSAELLDWRRARPGDVFYIPAGTVHAIGPDCVLLEVQQPSDVTFRLDDYGRGRALHLEQGLAVARPTDAGPPPPYPEPSVSSGSSSSPGRVRLETPYFRLLEHRLTAATAWTPSPRRRWLVAVSPASPRAVLPRGYALEIPPLAGWRWPGTAEEPQTVVEIEAPPPPDPAAAS